MNENKVFRTLVIVCVIGLLFSVPAVSFAATTTTKTDSYQIGLPGVVYHKDTVQWTYNATKITAWDGWQKDSGLLSHSLGVKKLATSTTQKFLINCKSELLFGFKIGGTTIGIKSTRIKQAAPTYKGTISWKSV